MTWTTGQFVELLRTAISDARNDGFSNTIEGCRSHGGIILSDDGSFETLCKCDNYVIFIHQLLDCWVDSISHPTAYGYIDPKEWLGFAESLFHDIELGRVPSHAQWNNVFTIRCELCGNRTTLHCGEFTCQDCRQSTEFKSPFLNPNLHQQNQRLIKFEVDDLAYDLPTWRLASIQITQPKAQAILGHPHFVESDPRATAGGTEDHWTFLTPNQLAAFFRLRVPYDTMDLCSNSPQFPIDSWEWVASLFQGYEIQRLVPPWNEGSSMRHAT